MPYRRLPNTDRSRIATLKAAIAKDGVHHRGQLVISYTALEKARLLLQRFTNAQLLYKQSYENQITASKSYQNQVKKARLYVSHFMQVLNFCFIRKEIKRDFLKTYGLDEHDKNEAPDLTLDQGLLYWGKQMIDGETGRIQKGGTPIYNPTIAKVKVHYDLFADAYAKQKNLQGITARELYALSMMRPDIDALILDIWNQIEEAFAHEPQATKIRLASDYGVIYYYRSSEKKALVET